MGLVLTELLLGRRAKINVLHWKHTVSCAIGRVLTALRKLECGLLPTSLPSECFLRGGAEGTVCYLWPWASPLWRLNILQTQAKQAEGIFVKWEEELNSEAGVLIKPPEWGGRRNGERVIGSWEDQSSIHLYPNIPNPTLLCGRTPPLTRIF